MEKLSPIETRLRLAAPIRVQPYHHDHRFDGKAVLPAVEAMAALASSVGQAFPQIDTRLMADARFERFLFLPPAPAAVDAFHELAVLADGRVRADLVTYRPGRAAAISRLMTHAGVTFGRSARFCPSETAHPAGAFKIAAERLYYDLVPFGAAFQSVCGSLELAEMGAAANICCRNSPLLSERLGCLGVLDGAFHLACAWGQRYAGFVGFPVGFALRHLESPASPGIPYRAHVSICRPAPTRSGRLLFDIWIYGPGGVQCDMVAGVEMRDVSRGRLRPPAWVGRRR